LETTLTSEFDLTFNWHYYRDGGWLCKVAHKKKTIFWLSIWDGYFQAGFFFLERHLEGITKLGMNENNFTVEKIVAKLTPFVFKIDKKGKINDLLKIIKYKKQPNG